MENKNRKHFVAIFIAAMMVASVLTVISTVQAAPDDYYMYGDWNLGGSGNEYLTGVNGYVDSDGYLGDPGAEYIFFTGGPSYCGSHTAYVYRVDTAGDPNMHPDNPDATGPIAPRTFSLVSTHDMGSYCSGHDNAFYIDDTGIYYGASSGWGGIYHWDFDWSPVGWEVSIPAPANTQTLACNPDNGDWWVGLGNRELYKWDGSAWIYQFTHPDLAGDHHDGMEIIDGSLIISDMTSDKIIQYRLDISGNVIDPPGTPYNTFTYTTTANRNVEGMGYGPNKHIWISSWDSYTIYELGGGALQIAIEGIPDQCIFTGEVFDTFDLDDYTVGTPPFTWTYSGNINLVVSIDAENVVTLTYPAGWSGSETIIFAVADSQGNTASDDATFKVCPVPVVGDIPDQVSPFVPFDLDEYLSEIDPGDVTWSASYACDSWTVDFDSENVVTVTAPDGANEPCTITFTATTYCCDREASDSDDAIFTPNQPPDVSEAYPSIECLWPPNQKFVNITIEGVTDPDCDEVTITITGITSDEPTAEIKGAGGDKHAPDAEGVGTDTASVRAERSGTGNGRVYEITFVASDGIAETEGSVFVKVPHDQSDDCESIDDGQNYDATAIN